MKFKITMEDLVEATWQVVNGTCRSSDITGSIEHGVYELLAKAYNKATDTTFSYNKEALDTLSTLVAQIFEERDFEEAFWDRMAGTGQDHCNACGWWGEDVLYSPDDYEDAPITEGCMCGECAEELEEV
tara:strand:- start:2038 stop:2424 length:387 start_codon:yes stop_codon:yes gene_type:complete